MNYLRSILGSSMILLGVAGTSSGAWVEIDDFEDGFEFMGSPVVLADNNEASPTNNGWLVAGNLTSASRQVLTDPDGMHPNNEVLAIIGGGSDGLGMVKPGSVSVADGSTATVFFRYRIAATATSAKPSIGVSLNDAGIATGASGPYMLVGDNTSTTYRLQSYSPTAVGITEVDPDAWYSVWMAVHNNASPADDTVSLYLQRDDGTGPFATQTQLTWDNGGVPDSTFHFRSDKSTTLTDFFFRANSAHAGQRTIFFDDIYYDNSGVVLTNPLATAMPGDFDGDGDVDGADFVVWQTNFPANFGHNSSTGDADGDGDVDGADFAAWQDRFPTGSGGTTPIPEPCSVLLAMLGVMAFVNRQLRAHDRSL